MRKSETDAIRRARVQQLLQDRDELKKRVKETLKEGEAVRDDANRIFWTLPAKASTSLVDRRKRGALKVTWEYLKVEKERLDDGREVTTRTWYPHDFGTLKGVGAWLESNDVSHKQDLYALFHKLETIPNKKSLTKAELESAESVIREISGLNSIRRELSTQRALIADFCRMENLLLLVQLTSNRSIRAEIVTAVHEISGTTLPSEASRIVDAIDRAVREQHRADGLRIAS
ncbi:hypothetical protein D3C77_191740 [compost metagenome]